MEQTVGMETTGRIELTRSKDMLRVCGSQTWSC